MTVTTIIMTTTIYLGQKRAAMEGSSDIKLKHSNVASTFTKDSQWKPPLISAELTGILRLLLEHQNNSWVARVRPLNAEAEPSEYLFLKQRRIC